MKLTKRQLKRIIRKTLNESGDIYPRPQHPMIAQAQANSTSSTSSSPELQRVVNKLKDDLMGVDVGYSEEEANEAILLEVEEILGLR